MNIKDKIRTILEQYGYDEDEIEIVIKFLSLKYFKYDTATYHNKRIFNYSRQGFFTITIDINLKDKFLYVQLHNIEEQEQFTLVQDYIENFEIDNIEYDIQDIENIIESFSNLNENRYE